MLDGWLNKPSIMPVAIVDFYIMFRCSSALVCTSLLHFLQLPQHVLIFVVSLFAPPFVLGAEHVLREKLSRNMPRYHCLRDLKPDPSSKVQVLDWSYIGIPSIREDDTLQEPADVRSTDTAILRTMPKTNPTPGSHTTTCDVNVPTIVSSWSDTLLNICRLLD